MITGWIFTSSADKTIKRRLSTNWNLESVYLKSRNSNNFLSLHSYINGNWRMMKCKEDIEYSMNEGGRAFVIFKSFPTSNYFVEQIFDLQNFSLAMPKFSTYRLCDASTLGKSTTLRGQESALPLERLVSCNKEMNEKIKVITLNLLKCFENRLDIQISKLKCIYFIEEQQQQQDEEEEGGNKYRIWFHHMNGVLFRNRIHHQHKKSSNIYSERKSVTSDASTSSIIASKKCVGDFCHYVKDEEIHIINIEKESELHQETLHAKERHRRLTSTEKSALLGNEDEDVEEEGEGVGDDIGVGDVTDDTENLRLHTNDVKERSEEVFSKDGTHTSLAASSSATGKDTTSRRVPFKAIALARQEMSVLHSLKAKQSNTTEDTAEDNSNQTKVYRSAVAWPDPLIHWWLRIGHSFAPARAHTRVPITAGFEIGNRLVTVNENEDNHSTHPSGKDSAIQSDHMSSDLTNDVMKRKENWHNRKSLSAPTPSMKSLEFKVNTNNTMLSHHDDLSTLKSTESSSVPYDLIENPLDISASSQYKLKLGHISGYYSNADVCETCYYVYRELDRRREMNVLKLLKKKKRVVDKTSSEISSELEHKIFLQKQLISRLSKGKVEMDNNDFDENQVQ